MGGQEGGVKKRQGRWRCDGWDRRRGEWERGAREGDENEKGARWPQTAPYKQRRQAPSSHSVRAGNQTKFEEVAQS